MPIRPSEVLEQIYASGQAADADGTHVAVFPSGVPRRHASELQRLVREHDCRRTLEVGLAFGISAMAIGAVHLERGEGRHIAIDPNQPFYRSIGLLNLERTGLSDRVRVLEERSEAALPRLREEGVRIDFALIDGRHVFDTALLDFYYVDLLLDVGGLVAFHDTWMPSVAQVVAYVRRNRLYEPVAGGDRAMRVLRKTGTDHRNWYEHHGFAADPNVRWSFLRRRLTRLVLRRPY